jgi:hypothetical protein
MVLFLNISGTSKLVPPSLKNKFSIYFLSIVALLLFSCAQQEEQQPNNSTEAVPENEAVSAPISSADTLKLSLPWLVDYEIINSIENRISPPQGYTRIALADSNFGWWLRKLPLKAGKPQVKLHNGQLKYNQSAHYAVLDIDVGTKDLQQCADAVMRLRAEYLWWAGLQGTLSFNYTSGDKIPYTRWQKGERPLVKGNKVTWSQSARADAGYETFKKYLDNIFMYAGSSSLNKELAAISLEEILPGDVFIQGGFPGHAVTVMDVAQNEAGQKIFLLSQSYMPAQDIHILKNPNDFDEVWYSLPECTSVVRTPEWTFYPNDLKRF